MHFWPSGTRLSVHLFFALLFYLVHDESLLAQANPTASKQATYSFIGTLSLVDTDRKAEKNVGFTLGFDYTRYLFRYVTPSFEIRAKIAPGNDIGLNTFGGGARVAHRIKDFSPYADFFWSYGRINLYDQTRAAQNYRHDNSTVYSAGFGFDYDITSQWATRVDYQHEWWNIGKNGAFTPKILSFGVVYHVPFRNYKSR